MGRGKGKDKYKGLFGKELINAVSDEDGNITRDVNYILFMGNESSNKVAKDSSKIYMNDYTIPKLRH